MGAHGDDEEDDTMGSSKQRSSLYSETCPCVAFDDASIDMGRKSMTICCKVDKKVERRGLAVGGIGDAFLR